MTIRSSLATELIQRHPWLPFLLPFLVYMVVGSFEPSPPTVYGPQPAAEQTDRPVDAAAPPPALIEADNWFGLRYAHYPIVYSVKIALTIASMLFVLPGYRQFPFRISPLAIVVGVVGVVLWIGLCQLHLEQKLFTAIGLESLAGLGDAAVVQSARTTGRNAGLGLHLPGDSVPGPRARGTDHRRVFPSRPGDAVCRSRKLVGSAIRRSNAARRGGRDGGSHADAPGRALGRRCVVQLGHLAHDPHAQHLGLRRRPRSDQSAAGHLRRHAKAVAIVVRLSPLLRERPRVFERVRASVQYHTGTWFTNWPMQFCTAVFG